MAGPACRYGAEDAAPFRGVLPLPISALKSTWPVLGNPANRNRTVSLMFEHLRFDWRCVDRSTRRTAFEELVRPV
jgi:hypothetical protein